MFYQPYPKLEKAVKTYKEIKEKLEDKRQLQRSVPTENEESLVYYIDHLNKYIEEQDKVISEMSNVFNGIKKFIR